MAARIRSMKPEFRTSRTICAWPREVRLFFSLLWGYCDDHGYGLDDLDLIKADCFPLDADVTAETIDQWLNAIMAETPAGDPGPLCRFTVGRRRYIHCPSWGEHQRPSHPSKARYPQCPHKHDENEPSGESPEDRRSVPETRATVSGRARATLYPQPVDNSKLQVSEFARVSGDSRETLVPEQLAVSSEQGAVSRRQETENPKPPPPRPVIATVMNETDATESEAIRLVEIVAQRDPAPRNLGGFLRRLATDGELPPLLARLRADIRAQAGSTTHVYDPDDMGVCQYRRSGIKQPCPLPPSHSTHRVKVADNATTSALTAPTRQVPFVRSPMTA